jgi:hypothetical protein
MQRYAQVTGTHLLTGLYRLGHERAGCISGLNLQMKRSAGPAVCC